MKTNDHKVRNYSSVLEALYGAQGTPERAQFDEEAYTFYISQVLLDARENARITQNELAKRIGADKSYISQIERGITVPSVATFYRIINALGLSVEITPAAN
jgi:DNA-binding XRE family transcriptional regulator